MNEDKKIKFLKLVKKFNFWGVWKWVGELSFWVSI